MNIVKELCDRNGIQQQQLSEMVGVSQPAVSSWFNQKSDPKGKRLDKLEEIFGVSRAVILGYESLQASEQKKQQSTREDEQLAEFRSLLSQLNADQRERAAEYMRFLISQRK